MTDVVPEVEEFGHDVPMDPTMEPEDSEHSEELDISEAQDSEGHADDAGEAEDDAEQILIECRPAPSTPKYAVASSSNPPAPVSANH
ncbi:hypothetical protein COOONC_26939 [Cooperia oncophora]